MSLKELELKWELFSEEVWANFGLIIQESNDGWHSEDEPWENKEAYRFLKWAVPAILQTAEHYNQEKYRKDPNRAFTFRNHMKKQKDGFYLASERPDYMDANEELIDFLRKLSGREKFEMLQKILKLKDNEPHVLIFAHAGTVVQEMYATYILERILRK